MHLVLQIGCSVLAKLTIMSWVQQSTFMDIWVPPPHPQTFQQHGLRRDLHLHKIRCHLALQEGLKETS